MKLSEIFQKAKEIILEKGWVRGYLFLVKNEPVIINYALKHQDEICGVCAMGSIILAIGMENSPTYERNCFSIFRSVIGTDLISQWNDETVTSVDEVLEAFDKAIDKAKLLYE